MSLQSASPSAFKTEAKHALHRPQLKVALDRATNLLQGRRADVIANYPEFEKARKLSVRIKDHTLENLDPYIEQFTNAAEASGAKVHFADTPEDATRVVIEICKTRKAKTVTRVKSMLGEEIGLPAALAEAGIVIILHDVHTESYPCTILVSLHRSCAFIVARAPSDL